MRLDQIAHAGGQGVTNADIESIKSNLSNSDQAWETYLNFPADGPERRIAATVSDARDDLKKNGLEPLLAALIANDPAAKNRRGVGCVSPRVGGGRRLRADPGP